MLLAAHEDPRPCARRYQYSAFAGFGFTPNSFAIEVPKVDLGALVARLGDGQEQTKCRCQLAGLPLSVGFSELAV
jgi:hypothetical protein